jgi:hypothetical protein
VRFFEKAASLTKVNAETIALDKLDDVDNIEEKLKVKDYYF